MVDFWARESDGGKSVSVVVETARQVKLKAMRGERYLCGKYRCMPQPLSIGSTTDLDVVHHRNDHCPHPLGKYESFVACKSIAGAQRAHAASVLSACAGSLMFKRMSIEFVSSDELLCRWRRVLGSVRDRSGRSVEGFAAVRKLEERKNRAVDLASTILLLELAAGEISGINSASFRRDRDDVARLLLVSKFYAISLNSVAKIFSQSRPRQHGMRALGFRVNGGY